MVIFYYTYRYSTELYENLYFLNVFMLNRISIKYTHMVNAIIMASLIALGRLNAKVNFFYIKHVRYVNIN